MVESLAAIFSGPGQLPSALQLPSLLELQLEHFSLIFCSSFCNGHYFITIILPFLFDVNIYNGDKLHIQQGYFILWHRGYGLFRVSTIEYIVQVSRGLYNMNYSTKTVKKYRAGNITAAFGADLMVVGATSVPNLLLKYYFKMGISDSEMMLLIQILRLRTEENNLFPTVAELSEYVIGDENQVQLLLDGLLDKEFINITQYYDFGNNVILEGIDFEPLFEKLSEMWACEKVKEIEETKNILEKVTSSSPVNQKDNGQPTQLNGQVLNLCALFEREFARPLSPMEVERIRQWGEELDTVLIMEALRRAVLMGKNNFRYIDAILMEWRKNNLRTLSDIERFDEEFKQKRIKSYGGTRRQQPAQSDKSNHKKTYDTTLMG
jgi:DNA replication protein